MRCWWRYVVVPAFNRRAEKVAMWIVWHLPRWVVYWSTIRATAHATQGPWSGEEVPAVPAVTVLQRWAR